MNKKSPLCSTLAVLAVTAMTLHATEYIWDKGAGTLDWNDPVNWTSDTKPGTADTARFDATGLVTGDTVLLGANQTISTLNLNAPPNTFSISGGGSYGLTLTSGYIKGTDGGPVRSLTIDAPVALGAEGYFEGYGGYGSWLTITGPISDGGNGYGVLLAARNNNSFAFKGNNTYTGDTIVRGKDLSISGPDGAIRSSRLVLRQSAGQPVMANLLNTVDANTDRLGDAKAVRCETNGGGLYLTGHATTPIKEEAGVLELTSGTAKLEAAYVKDSGTPVELNFSGFDRAPGTALLVMNDTTADRSNFNTTPVISIDGLADGYLPYATHPFYDPTHVYAQGGVLKRFTAYTALPTSGGDANILYHANTGLSLAGAVQTRGLVMRDDSANRTLDLGAYDLRLADGSVGFRGNGRSHTIQSSGGRLVFGTTEVVIFAAGSGASTMTISAPIATDVAGPHHLIIPSARSIAKLALTGEDQIHDYVNLTLPDNTRLELGGSGDRTFTGNITGMMNLTKSGAGSLRLTGADLRGYGTTSATGGRLVIGSATALRFNTWSDGDITVTNTILEVESGIVWNGRFTIQANATLTGDGKFNTAKTMIATTHVAPGKTVGKLTTAALTFGADSHIDWQIGNGVTTPGADYDLLRVEGNLTLPTGAVTLNIGDAGTRTTPLRNQSFTVAEWTGTDPASAPTWSIVNQAPETVDASGAQLSIDLANNKIVLTGLKDVTPPATVIVVR